MIDNTVTGWVIEAYCQDTEQLAWDLPLSVLVKEGLERELKISLRTPDSYPITVQQVVAAVRAFASEVSSKDLDLDSHRLSFFLAAVVRG